MLIAQISDMHVRRPGELANGVVNTEECLKRCIARVNAFLPQPDVAIFTGDLVDSGAREEYEHLRSLLAPLTMPYYLIPGNHDERKALRIVFHDHAYVQENGPFIQYVVSDFPIRMVLLDTLDPGKDGGVLDEPRLTWLEARLSEAISTPTIVFMHHPPFETGVRGMDEINCRGGGEMAKIIRRFPQVERVACGHVHRSIQMRWANTMACVAPSCAHQIALELRNDNDLPLEFILEPPAFLLHLWRAGKDLVTHTCVVDNFSGPYRFAD